MDRADIVIIGGGVVGCAVARAVSQRWQNVFVLEQMPRLGMAASSRNSGVIHSGLYYRPGSLKARHCVAGNRLTYEFCAAHHVAHRRTGKLVVTTTPEEEARLLKEITDKYYAQTTPYYAASRLWVDDIIDPADTRVRIAEGIKAANNAPVEQAFNVGVFQV